MNGEHQLYIFLGKTLVGLLGFNDEKYSLNYSAHWQETGFALSPSLPLQGDISTGSIQRFLSNLLPEGEGLDAISRLFQLSKRNVFGLINALGGDLPGALVISNQAELHSQPATVRPLTVQELAERLGQRTQMPIAVWDLKPRLSVAGIQDKLNIFIDSKSNMGFAEGELCSTHLLKFEKGADQHHLVLNEYISMQLAAHCGLPVADHSLEQFGEHRALVVKRFDRNCISDQLVKRRYIIDGCQALDLSPDYKYERNFGNGRDVAHIREGASLNKLFKLTANCIEPAKTQLALIDWVLFNCLICNADAHGKNISFYVNHDGLRLAPFYDIVSIGLFDNFEQDFAMALGDSFDSRSVHAYQIADFADSCNLPRRLVAKRLVFIGEKLLQPIEFPYLTLSLSEKKYLQSYRDYVTNRTKELLSEADLINHIEL